MPEPVPISGFLDQTWEDFKSPTTSTFHKNLPKYKDTVSQIEEALDADRSELNKLKKSVRALYNTTSKHAQNEKDIAENLERIGRSSSESHKEIKTALHEFSKVTKVLATLIEDLSKSLHNSFQFPLESILKGDIKGVKGDLRKPFDKATKDYESKFSKLEKESKKQAQDRNVLYRSELTGNDVAEDMENERKIFQLRMCRYLIKVNEIKTKKGVDLLNYLSDYYKAVKQFFDKGQSEVDKHMTFVDDLSKQLTEIKQGRKSEHSKLHELETQLQSSMTSFKEPVNSSSSAPGYSLHQLQGNKDHGSTRDGYLLKKSEGMLKKIWQKRKCRIKDGIMSISHSDETKEPVRLNLLTCQVKLVSDDPGKKCFDVVTSHGNRTYHFQADDEKDMKQWISVLSNAKEEVLLRAFKDSGSASTMNESVKELTKDIIKYVMKLPGNQHCCDCGADKPVWLSTNLGVLICLECCGIHRNLGVHISRTQSLEIDQLNTSQLLLARFIGNNSFNEVLQARLGDRDPKLTPTSQMQEREDFIKAKYIQHRFTIQECSELLDLQAAIQKHDKHEPKITYRQEREDFIKAKYIQHRFTIQECSELLDLQAAIQNGDIQGLLQVHAEGVDLMSVLPDSKNGETGLHFAIEMEDSCSCLHVVDFIVQNSNISSLSRVTRDGNTCLHLCALQNKSECMKCLLRTKPDIAHIKNNAGLTALDIANEKKYELCAELLKAAMAGKKDVFEHINIEWDLVTDEAVDYSDDDLEVSQSKPDRRQRSRPNSLVTGAEFGAHSDGSGPRPQKPKKHHLTHPTRFRNSLRNIPGMVGNHNSQIGGGLPGFNVTVPGGQKSPDNPPLPPRVTKKTLPGPGGGVGGSGAESLNVHVRSPSEPETDIPYKLHRRTPSEPPVRPKPMEGDRKTIHFGQPAQDFRSSQPAIDQNRPEVPPRPRLPSAGDAGKPSDEIPPVPAPRRPKKRRCRAKYDCDADNEDELTFREGEVIVLLREEEEEWWEGEVENQPHRRGLFPISFVEHLPD